MALAVRTCCQDIGDSNSGSSSAGGTTSTSCHEALITFFAILATRVVRICSLTTRSSNITPKRQDEWERQLHRKAVALCYHRRDGPSDEHVDGDDSNTQRQRQIDDNIPLRYTLLATTELIFSQIHDSDDELGREIKKDGPRFLASIDTAALCTHMGMLLFQIAAERRKTLSTTTTTSMALPETPPPPSSSDDTISEADAMCIHFKCLVQLCPQLKKVGNVFSFPHLQRVKQLVGYLEKYYRYCGEVSASNGSGARRLGGRCSGSFGSSNGGKRMREGSLMSWVKVMDDDDDESKGDDDDSDTSSDESSVGG